MDTRIIWMMIYFTCTIGGDLCDEDRNECELGSAPCRQKGVCHNSVGSYRCDCVPGWEGSHCQYSDGSGLNTCPTGYTGVKCTYDFDECTQWSGNPCEYGSTCVNTPGSLTCNCATGWEGIICNKDINECNFTSGPCHNGGNCTNIPGTYKCECPYSYTGHTCDDVPTKINTPTYSSVSPKEDNSDDSDGDTNLWGIVGPVVGIIVIAGTFGAGLFVYYFYYRKAHKVDAGNETEVETITQDSTIGDSNNHSKWNDF